MTSKQNCSPTDAKILRMRREIPAKSTMTEAQFSVRDAIVSQHIVDVLKDMLVSMRDLKNC
jgi:hypothetical protein